MKHRASVSMHDRVFVRVLPDEKAVILAAAMRQGVTLSGFTRQTMTEPAQRLAA